MSTLLASLLAGLLFGAGLVIGGMTLPAKVVGFLDFFGDWDPSLMFVMGGAILVHATVYRVIRKRPTPLLAAAFTIPVRSDIDARLIGGAAMFGVGWGLGGFCPGPAVTSLVSGHMPVLTFVGAMVAGMCLHHLVRHVPAVPAPASGRHADSSLPTPAAVAQGPQDS